MVSSGGVLGCDGVGSGVDGVCSGVDGAVGMVGIDGILGIGMDGKFGIIGMEGIDGIEGIAGVGVEGIIGMEGIDGISGIVGSGVVCSDQGSFDRGSLLLLLTVGMQSLMPISSI